MKRETLEKYQALIYLAAIGCGLALGLLAPERTEPLKTALWPLLACLLYVTFCQVPLAHLRAAVSDLRFFQAAVLGNFVLIPLLLWILVPWLPPDPGLRLGVLLVLLMPCTDWFITFTHLGGGDTHRAIAFAPASLLLQMLCLPVYLGLFLGDTFVVALAGRDVLLAFVGLILLPLLAAFLTERWVERAPDRRRLLERLAWLPVPLLALVVLIIATSQVRLVAGSFRLLGPLLLVFAGYLGVAAFTARLLARWFALPPAQGRVLAFSLGTRNSFVVLPLALALPPPFQPAVVAIVFQSIVELLGMIGYLWWIPGKLFPDPPKKATSAPLVPTKKPKLDTRFRS